MTIDLPTVDGGWDCIVADPPWTFVTRSDKGKGRSPEQHYSVMSLDDIMAMPVKDVAADDCHLFLWTTGPVLPDAFRVIDAWGFRYSGMGFVWIKTKRNFSPVLLKNRSLMDRDLHIGLGYTTRKNAEFVLLARRGQPKRASMSVHEVIISKVRSHSRKPDEFYRRVTEYCDGTRLELFGREKRLGFEVWGNEVDKFTTEQEAI